eukprot:CFRG6849T1
MGAAVGVLSTCPQPFTRTPHSPVPTLTNTLTRGISSSSAHMDNSMLYKSLETHLPGGPQFSDIVSFCESAGITADATLIQKSLTHGSREYERLGLLGKRALHMFMTEFMLERYGSRLKASTLKLAVQHALSSREIDRVLQPHSIRKAIVVVRNKVICMRPEDISERLVQSCLFAVVGAVYSTQGPAAVQKLVSQVLLNDGGLPDQIEDDLQMAFPGLTIATICRLDGIPEPTATWTPEKGKYAVQVVSNGIVIGVGVERNVKAARHEALLLALQTEPFVTRLTEIPVYTEMDLETRRDLDLDFLTENNVIIPEEVIMEDAATRAHF